MTGARGKRHDGARGLQLLAQTTAGHRVGAARSGIAQSRIGSSESQLNRDVRLDGKIMCTIAFSVVHLTFTSFITAALTLNDFGILKMLGICAVVLVVQLPLPRKSWDEASRRDEFGEEAPSQCYFGCPFRSAVFKHRCHHTSHPLLHGWLEIDGICS